MQGMLDDVRIYNRVLSQPEIQALLIPPSIALQKPGSADLNTGRNTLSSLNDLPDGSDRTSAAETNGSQRIQIYPNPFTSELNISTSAELSRIELIDLSGKVVRFLSVKGQTYVTLSTEDLKPGMYLLKIFRNKGPLEMIKVIKY